MAPLCVIPHTNVRFSHAPVTRGIDYRWHIRKSRCMRRRSQTGAIRSRTLLKRRSLLDRAQMCPIASRLRSLPFLTSKWLNSRRENESRGPVLPGVATEVQKPSGGEGRFTPYLSTTALHRDIDSPRTAHVVAQTGRVAKRILTTRRVPAPIPKRRWE